MYLIALAISCVVWMLGIINTTLERICDVLEAKENDSDEKKT